MRGPSSSAASTRCHWPSTSSPPVTCSVRLWPRSIARRWASALLRSQSECSGSLCLQLPARETVDSRNCLMSAWSADWFSLMKTAHVVCSDQRLTSPSLTPDGIDHARDAFGQVDELHPLGRLQAEGLGVDDEPAGRGHVTGRCLPAADNRTLTHRLQSSYGPRDERRKSLILQVLYCRAQLTMEPPTEVALPGDHGKWVRIPRGAATVSGECCFLAGSDRGQAGVRRSTGQTMV